MVNAFNQLLILSALLLVVGCDSRISVLSDQQKAIDVIPPEISFGEVTGTSGSAGSAMSIVPTTFQSGGEGVSCSISPSLPAGLSINSSTCEISGTPTTSISPTTFTISVTNSAGTVTDTVTLSVAASAPSISYSGSTGTSGGVGNAMNVVPTTLEDNGSAITSCTTSPALPSGLSINGTTCVISGTPSAIMSSTTYTIEVTNGIGSKTASVTLVVAASVPSISYSGSTGTSGIIGNAMSVSPTTLEDNAAAITNCTASPTLPSGLSINATTCVISGTPTVSLASTEFTITATNSVGPNTANVTLTIAAVAPTISYATSTGTSGTAGSAMSVAPSSLEDNGAAITNCTASPTLPDGLSISATTCVISGTPTVSLASTDFTITATNSAGPSTANVTLVIAAGAPTISYATSTGTSGTVGSAMSVTPSSLKDNGAAITNCTASPTLPSGLSISATTCVISGTPTVSLASTEFTITATNSVGPNTANVTLTIAVGTPTISYATSTGTSGTAGSAMSVTPSTLEDNGAAITNCTASPTLPDGLSISATTCVISGTPTVSLASTEFTITATNSVGPNTANVTLTIAVGTPTISYATSTGTSGTAGSAMSVTPSSLEDNGAAITNCTASPTLPSGMSISATTCVISGTPTVSLASTVFTITATNSAGPSTANVTLAIAAGAPTISYDSSTGTSGTAGSAMSVTPSTLADNGAAITNCTASPTLPSGLSISATTCVISGTPTVSLASTEFTITATNSVGFNTANVTLVIAVGAPTISYATSTGTSGTVGSAMSVTPSTLEDNGSAITNCTVSPTLPSGLSISGITCVISGTPTVTLASTEFTITATNSVGLTNAAVTLTVGSFSCPTNYLIVPGNAAFGTNNFCVMKFEAKCVGTDCPTPSPNNDAISQADLTPWVSVTIGNSKTACTNLGVGYDLISNPEWLTIAYDIEATASNWDSGVVGTGALFRGHSDNSPASALAVSNAADPYSGTGNNSGQAMGSGKEQKRTFTLSNGEVIWDFSGNVFEWTDWTLGGNLVYGPTSCTAAWIEFPNVSCAEVAAGDFMPGNPAGVPAANYDSVYGLGRFHGGTGGATARSGSWSFGANVGAFMIYMNSTPTSGGAAIGFRCVYRP